MPYTGAVRGNSEPSWGITLAPGTPGSVLWEPLTGHLKDTPKQVGAPRLCMAQFFWKLGDRHIFPVRAREIIPTTLAKWKDLYY